MLQNAKSPYEEVKQLKIKRFNSGTWGFVIIKYIFLGPVSFECIYKYKFMLYFAN